MNLTTLLLLSVEVVQASRSSGDVTTLHFVPGPLSIREHVPMIYYMLLELARKHGVSQ